ncbi:putative ixoderin precursor [Ixodes scapularis]
MILHIVVLSTVLSFGLSVDSGSLLLALAKAQQHVRELSAIVANIRENAIPRDCSDLQRAGQNTSGVYTIFVSGGTTGRPVYCDMNTEGGGWTVIQNRGQFGNNVFYFYRNWTEYARGFGEPGKEYWIGNNALHALTSEGRNQTLRIELRNGTGETFVAHYSAFKVASESNFYKLNVSGYSGPAGTNSLNAVDFVTIAPPEIVFFLM